MLANSSEARTWYHGCGFITVVAEGAFRVGSPRLCGACVLAAGLSVSIPVELTPPPMAGVRCRQGAALGLPPPPLPPPSINVAFGLIFFSPAIKGVFSIKG